MDRDIWLNVSLVWLNVSLVWLVAMLCGVGYLLFQVWG